MFTAAAAADRWRSRHTFAPLAQSRDEASSAGKMRLEGVIFDMDGTLCQPQNYMFGEMRTALSIPKEVDILDHVHSLAEDEQSEAFAKIKAIERRAMAKQVPQAGLVTLLEYLDRKGIKKGICTRNFDAPVAHLLEAHVPAHINPLSPIVTRDFRPPKPSPAGILHIAHAWQITSTAAVPESAPVARPLPLLMVGDSIDDMISGRDAGCFTVLLKSEGKEALEQDERTDFAIGRLDELVDLLENGIQARSFQ